jgi:hypothetical protein
VQAVIETPAYLASADDAGMSEAERKAAVDTIAANPEAGDLIVGSGGCRKVRIAGRGKGKSGGYRVVTYYAGESLPVFLLTVFSKGERSNLTKGETNALAVLVKTLADSLGRKAVALRSKP